MPQIIIKGMELEKIQNISKTLVDELQQIIGCPRDYFTIEAVNSVFIMDGEQAEISPFVQINWFDRGQEIQDQVAATIYKHVISAGYRHVETFFVVLEESRYYENQMHY